MSRRSEPRIKLRRCTPEDLKKVMEIEDSSFNHPYSRHIFTYFLQTHPEGFIVSEESGEVVGYIIFSTSRGRGLIVSLAVLPRFRRRGHGKLLLQQALEELSRRVDAVELQVRVSNREAVEFYMGQGFRLSSKISSYYPDGEDALVMVRSL